MNWIESLIEEYSCGNSEFIKSFQGADMSDIAALEKVVRNKLPEDYVEFLLTCGASDGGLLDHIPAHTDIKSLLLTYEEAEEFPDDFPNGEWVIVGSGHSGVDFIMSCDSGVVHDGCYDDEGSYFASSFSSMVSQQAFLQYKIIKSAQCQSYSSSLKGIVDLRGEYDPENIYRELFELFSSFSKISELSDKRKILAETEGANWYVEVNPGGILMFVAGEGYLKNISEISKLTAIKNMRVK